MKIAAGVCNAVLFGFTCIVLLVDGFPVEAAYIVFTLWLMATLIVSAVVMFLGATNGERTTSAAVGILAILCNLFSLGFFSWAFLDQYPHPREDGFVAFVILSVLTPVLTLGILFRDGAKHHWLRLARRAERVTAFQEGREPGQRHWGS